MQFNSVHFMVFFPIVVGLYFIMPRKWRSLWLLLASYYFYMSWNVKYATLILFSTAATYAGALFLEKVDSQAKKKWILTATLVINLLILAVFKYADFLLDSISEGLVLIGFGSFEARLNLLLPVGISFYTFQALGYIIDVYRGDIKAERSFLRYALFVSFFPQLVAGPIERSKNLLKQVQDIPKFNLWNLEQVSSGAILMVWGFFLKMVIADRIGILVDYVFYNYTAYGSVELILAAMGFALQIYCDFGSYSIIAMGAARIMGFTLMENFNTPYFALSIKDFWARWHISLSSWFRDYLYIPLGGNRKGNLRKNVNKMIVFLLSGLWHGASWNFVVWGGIHGAYQVVSDVTAPVRKKWLKKWNIKTECFSYKLLQAIITFVLVDFAWVFFRADSLRHALSYFKQILLNPNPWVLFNGGVYSLGLDRVEMNILMFSVLALLCVELIRYKKGIMLDAFLKEQNLYFSWLLTIGLIVVIFVYGKYGVNFNPQQFIYFQF